MLLCYSNGFVELSVRPDLSMDFGMVAFVEDSARAVRRMQISRRPLERPIHAVRARHRVQ
jgi:hypothetical protein